MQLLTESIDIQTPTGLMRASLRRPVAPGRFPGVILFPEIYQETGPISRLAAMLAGHGLVVAVPEVYHEYLDPGTVLDYDESGTALGNDLKQRKPIAAHDGDARATFDRLLALEVCSGLLGSIGVCLGGHLALRAALDPRCGAAACFYATDVHSRGLGAVGTDATLERLGEVQGDLLLVWGRQDPHVPEEGRALIRSRLAAAGTRVSWHEVNAEHAFLRDEGRRYDPELALRWLRAAIDHLRAGHR